jgi:acetyl-CoA carboxylase biotin carboxyl carrier protein
LDIQQIRELIELMIEKDVAEFEIEQHGVGIRIRRPEAVAATAMPMAPAAPAALPGARATAVAAPEQPAYPGAHMIASPMVGTFYGSPEPTADAFVQIGDRVEEGQTLCIVEAMKLMNEITADVTGEVIAVLAENAQPVEYGQELFAIRQD